jgi:hypothetical protein
MKFKIIKTLTKKSTKKKIKRRMTKLKNIILKDIRIEDNLKINNTFIKEPRKKIKNSNK